MPRPPTPQRWVDRVRVIAANEPRLGPGPIFRRLEEEGGKEGLNDYPSLRTIGRILRDFKDRPDAEKAPYRYFYWPETMERGELPWEASAAALEFLRYCTTPIEFEFIDFTTPDERHARPLTRTVKWYWRASLAAPDAPAYRKVILAEIFAAYELAGWPAESARGLELLLAFRPWRSPENRDALRAAGYYEDASQKALLRSFGAMDKRDLADIWKVGRLRAYSELLLIERFADWSGKRGVAPMNPTAAELEEFEREQLAPGLERIAWWLARRRMAGLEGWPRPDSLGWVLTS